MDRADLKRLDEEYRRRSADQGTSAFWSASNPVVARMLADRLGQQFAALRAAGVDFNTSRVLDVGCGGGGDLHRFAEAGFSPDRLFGIDYMWDRVSNAHRDFPAYGFARADGSRLPFRDAAFDLVTQFTAFTAVADAELKRAMAAEMWRVLRPGGHVLWYDMRPPSPAAARTARLAHAVERNLVSPQALVAKVQRKLAARKAGLAAAAAATGTTVVPIDAAELQALFPAGDVTPVATGVHFAIAGLALRFGEAGFSLARRLPDHATHWLALIRK